VKNCDGASNNFIAMEGVVKEHHKMNDIEMKVQHNT
jgi:hypothetical protein